MPDIIGIYAAIIGTLGFILAIYFAHPSNKLELTIDENSQNNFADARVVNIPETPVARYFQIIVKNNHKRKAAKNCRVYLSSIKEIGNEKEFLSSELPLKWRGYQIIMIGIEIPPKQERKFDAFQIFHQNPSELQINAFIDSSSLMPRLSGNKKLKAIYRVTADNFKTKEKTFIITLSTNLNDVAIHLI